MGHENLSERKKLILKAIVEAHIDGGLERSVQVRGKVDRVDLYIRTAEPVGSKAIAALPDMKAPAKIRNKQLLMDAEDEVIGYEDKLLGFSCNLSIFLIFFLSSAVRSCPSIR